MNIGIMTGSGFDPDPTLPGMINNARRIDQMGFDSLWMATIYGFDALTALTAITHKPDKARADIDQKLGLYRNIPSCRAMLDREGATGPGEIALVGDQKALRQQLQRPRDIGVTDLNAVPMDSENGAYERTLDFLATELKTAN